MQSADLSRPVVEVTSFLTGEKEYQIYSYGEQVIVMPLKDLMSGP
jgi:ATPase